MGAAPHEGRPLSGPGPLSERSESKGESKGFLHRLANTLDAGDSLLEGTFCLIMVIGATSAVRTAWGEDLSADDALWTAWLLVGAWAVIDAGFVVVSDVFRQGRARLAARQAGERPPRVAVARDVWTAALASLCMTVLVALPALAPFWWPGDSGIELWASNAIAIATLYWLGWFWARWTDFPRWLCGAGLALIGLIAVAVTVLLGVA
ncbi:MAG: VIT1/CCC1 transporter family protein [Microbacteriaceae bacterium]|nr:VIT1/CCC1 transporter family protein [Microbacteriaceae bacterium]